MPQMREIAPLTRVADQAELRDLARRIANATCCRINEDTAFLKVPDMPYREQFVLEELIKILQERV